MQHATQATAISYTATYSPEDNKIRLYASTRLDAETYARVKAAGFVWAPKQQLFVAPKWTPQREDLATELAGEIEPEEMTLVERAAMKAERLDNLANRRRQQAESLSQHASDLSQAFYMGQPILIGHHSERKARKTQERMHAAQRKANDAAKAASYWLYRAEGVEHFANMKGNPRVRANRIKTLLADLRDLQRDINAAHRALALWEKATSDDLIKHALGRLPSDTTLAGYDLYWSVEKGETSPADARQKCIDAAQWRIDNPNYRRWIEHILHRLAFERSLLGDVPRYDGELTPVILQAFAREHGADKPKCTAADDGFFLLESPVPLPAHLSAERWLELSADEWRDLMRACGYVVPAKKDAAAPILNLDVEVHTTINQYYRGEVRAYRVIKTDKATYGKIPNGYRGVRLSACGQYRFKVALARFIDKTAEAHDYVAVFLTDSKVHTLESE